MLGLRPLVRPIAEFVIPLYILPPFLLGGIFMEQKSFTGSYRSAGPLASGTAWGSRNYRVAGVSSLSTNRGLNFFYCRAVGTFVLVHTLVGLQR
jgi:hypothetical protein